LVFQNLRKGHGLKVFEKRMLRSILAFKKEEATESWRQLHNEEIHN
jgi:hypothetical protein